MFCYVNFTFVTNETQQVFIPLHFTAATVAGKVLIFTTILPTRKNWIEVSFLIAQQLNIEARFNCEPVLFRLQLHHISSLCDLRGAKKSQNEWNAV